MTQLEKKSRHTGVCVCATAALLALVAGPAARADAQGLNNEPYSFGGSGLGMSSAGKQAILSNQVLGIRPDNLVIGPGGVLLYAEPGPSGSAIVYDWYSVPVPGYRGRGWNSSWFTTRATGRLFFIDRPGGGDSTAAAISGWTGMIGGEDAMFAGYLLPAGLNTLDLLAWQVYNLSP